MSPSTSDSSQGKTPKSEPRDSPFPTPTSQSPSRPHRKRTRDESNDDDAGDMSLGGARHNIGRSMLTPSLLKHAQREVAKRMSALSAGRKSIVSGSAPRHIPEVPPPTGACDANDSVPELTPTSTGAQEADAKPFDPFVDMPAYGKGPRLMFAQLDADQQRVVEVAVKKGKNVCSVGGAGTGKSETCDILLDELRTKGKNVAIVTPSGTAAVNVRAQTLHSFFGLGGQNNKGIDKCKSQMRTTIKERLRNVDTLVIDEISMVSYEMFDRMDQMSRATRGDDIPFGGMQLIAFGDFCQLPPVKPQEHCYRCGRERQKITLQGQRLWQCSTSADHGDIIDGDKMWAFQSEQWDMMNFEYLPLNHVHRQANGPLLALLNKLRHGKPFTYKEERLLLDHPCDVTNAVELVSRLDAAQKINHSRFAQLADSTQDRPFYYHCRDDFDWKRDLHPELSNINQNTLVALSKHPYEEEVRLQIGQPVILQKNLDVQRGLVNGSQGVIQHFIPYDRYQQPRESGSEGSLLSYIRRQRVMSFMRDQGCPSLPVVKFNNLDAPEIVYPDCSILEKGYEAPHSLLIRTQIPLLSGWALTIHKAQGMTLDKAIVDLSHCFASGMSYVALSRVKTLEGLKVHGFKANGIKHEVDDKVKVFLSDKFGESFS